jgi:hypothetical protein
MGGGAPHIGGGGPHIGGGGVPHFAGRPAVSHFAAHPQFRSAGRPNFRSAARPSLRGGRTFAIHGGPNRVGGRAAASRSSPNTAFSHNRNAATPGQNLRANARSNAVRSALNSRAVAGALHNRNALRNPNARAQIIANAATAGWRGGHGDQNGWWRHRHGGYGWVGPLFWPFAYYDIYDYAMWDDAPFWDYGYDDIYAGMFAPYGYDDLSGYLPQGGGSPGGSPRRSVRPTTGTETESADQLTQMCGEDSRDIAGLPIDQIQQAIAPNDAQRAALDDLANASVKAAQDIKAACPTQVALTAPARLAAMQQRIEAMISGVGTVQPALQKFYDMLSDEQKARLNALGEDQRKAAAANNNTRAAQDCGAAQPGVTAWPTAEINAKLHPTDAQRVSLAALQDASAKAADMLKTSCQSGEAITPPARLEAVGKRLDVMLQAVKTVRAALDDFYGKLNDEQKAQFEAIGPARTALASPPTAEHAEHTHYRRHHAHANIGGIIRRLMSFAR